MSLGGWLDGFHVSTICGEVQKVQHCSPNNAIDDEDKINAALLQLKEATRTEDG